MDLEKISFIKGFTMEAILSWIARFGLRSCCASSYFVSPYGTAPCQTVPIKPNERSKCLHELLSHT